MAKVFLAAQGDMAKLASGLQDAGFQVEAGPDPSQTLSEPADALPDLLLVDVSLYTDNLSGLLNLVTRCKEMKLPLVALIPGDKLGKFDFTVGVDDFISTPTAPEEAVARLRQLLWRTRGMDSRDTLRYGELSIDLQRFEVSVERRRVFLTYKEFQLLKLLAESPGRVFTREMLLSRVWGYDYFGGTRTVDVHVRRLRSKIEEADRLYIETVRNVGYRFKAE